MRMLLIKGTPLVLDDQTEPRQTSQLTMMVHSAKVYALGHQCVLRHSLISACTTALKSGRTEAALGTKPGSTLQHVEVGQFHWREGF